MKKNKLNYPRIVKKTLEKLANCPPTFASLFCVMFALESDFCSFDEGYFSKSLTFFQMKKLIFKASNLLRQQFSFQSGDYVALVMNNSPYFIIAMWALIICGVTPILLNNTNPRSLVDNISRLVKIQAIISDEDQALTGWNSFNLPKNLDLFEQIPDSILDQPLGEFSKYLAFTSSGTTGLPKLCIYEASHLILEVLNAKTILAKNNYILRPFKGRARTLAFLPYYHIFGLIANYFWLSIFGVEIIFLSDRRASSIFNTIRKYRVTHLFAVPLLYETAAMGILHQLEGPKERQKFEKALSFSLFVQRLNRPLGVWLAHRLFKPLYLATFGPSIKFMISGGSLIKDEDLRLFTALGLPLFNGYGSTECAITSLVLSKKIKNRTTSFLDKPLPGASYLVNEQGELLIKSPFSASKIIFSHNQLVEEINLNPEEYFNTHDMVTYKGRKLCISGRSDEVIVLDNGEKITPEYLQNNLNLPQLHRLALIYDQELILLLDEKEVNVQNYVEVIRQLEAKALLLSSLGVKKVFFTDELLKSNEIKISTHRLLLAYQNNQLKLLSIADLKAKFMQVSYDESHLSQIVLQKIEAFLNTKKPINLDTNFFYDLGLSSLNYYNLISDIFSNFLIKYNYSRLFNCPGELVVFIKENVNETLSSSK
ncbi:MAG: AMP-binding protein [Acholeplasmatales bacterium]|jgi:long-subunit acyl-CoA synthetase (AMP-forming)/acyl carrier protein|nr:AMP-binding protein [Acholeplasmatales bacterium]